MWHKFTKPIKKTTTDILSYEQNSITDLTATIKLVIIPYRFQCPGNPDLDAVRP